MVLAVAALLLQFQLLQPPAQAMSIAPTSSDATTLVASPVRGARASSSVAQTDYVSATTESSSSRMNLALVHLGSADSKTQLHGALTTVALDTTADTQSFSTVRIPTSSSKENSVKEAMTVPSRNAWLALSIVEHGAAALDAYSTRQAVGHGAVEDDPFMRPFAHSPAIYIATQVGPVIFDLVARHMQRSEYPLVRRFWWMPQSISAGLSIFSGVHNLSVANSKP